MGVFNPPLLPHPSQVMVREPSVGDTIAILRGLSEKVGTV